MPQVLIVNSSYRKNSNSTALAGHVGKGAEKAGYTVRSIDIGRMRIDACRGCLGCTRPEVQYCVIKDDMQQIYPLLEASDVVIFASPVYWFNLCGQLKQFIDRCFAVAVSKPGREYSCFHGKKLGAVLVYGDADIFAAGGVNAVRCLQDISAYCKAFWAGVVYGTANDEGEILHNPGLLEQAERFGAAL